MIKTIPPIILEYVPILLPIILPNSNPKYVKNALHAENTIDAKR